MDSVLEPDTITVIKVEPVEVKQEEVVEQQEEVHTGPQPFEGIIAIGCNVTYYGKNYVFAQPADSIGYDENGIAVVNNIPYADWSETEINDAKE